MTEFLRHDDEFDYVEALRRCVAGLNDKKRRALELRLDLETLNGLRTVG